MKRACLATFLVGSPAAARLGSSESSIAMQSQKSNVMALIMRVSLASRPTYPVLVARAGRRPTCRKERPWRGAALRHRRTRYAPAVPHSGCRMLDRPLAVSAPMSVETRAVFYTVLLCVPLAAAMAMWVRWVWRRQAGQREAFGQSLADWGFRQNNAPMVGEFFWLGSRQRPVVLGFFQGRGAHLEVEVFEPCVMIMVRGAFQTGGDRSLTHPSAQSHATRLASRMTTWAYKVSMDSDTPCCSTQMTSCGAHNGPGHSLSQCVMARHLDGHAAACVRPEIEAALDSMTAWLDRV